MTRFPIRGASLRGMAAAAARNQPPNVQRWRRAAIKAARAAALDDHLDSLNAADGVKSAAKTTETKEAP